MSAQPIQEILSQLQRVKKIAPDKWTALCPAHDDRRPSLSIREADDGKILLHCWAGCGAADIVNALGLTLTDLFPRTNRYNVGEARSVHRVWAHREALQGIAHEAIIVRLFIERQAVGAPLDHDDLARLALADERIGEALRVAEEGR